MYFTKDEWCALVSAVQMGIEITQDEEGKDVKELLNTFLTLENKMKHITEIG